MKRIASWHPGPFHPVSNLLHQLKHAAERLLVGAGLDEAGDRCAQAGEPAAGCTAALDAEEDALPIEADRERGLADLGVPGEGQVREAGVGAGGGLAVPDVKDADGTFEAQEPERSDAQPLHELEAGREALRWEVDGDE